MEQHFFEQLLAIMATSLLATVLLLRLRMPGIVAYLLAGVLVGPQATGLVDQPGDFTFLAEFGVVFLLFSLGLEFSLPRLLALRSSVFGLGSIQVLGCGIVFGLAVWLWGTSPEAAVVIGGALALSSTAIVTKELIGRRQTQSRHGQLSVGVLLFQDLAAVLLLILVPVLAGSDTESLWSSLGWALGKGLLLVAILLSVGKWLLPMLYREVARTHSEEVFGLSTLVIVLLAAWVTHSFHLSMALGAFIIGMMLGESHFRHQINSDIRSFKDILLGLFFVTIGMNIQLELLYEFWPRILLFAVALILIKTLLICAMTKLSGDSTKTALQTGFNLAQAGEFGLALLTLGVIHNILPTDQASFIILVAVFSMAASPFLIRHSNQLADRLDRLTGGGGYSTEEADATPHRLHDHVIIGGFGRVGRVVAQLLENNHIDYIAIERDTKLVEQEKRDGVNIVYGDCTKKDILQSCNIASARLAVLTFNSLESARHTLEHLRHSGLNTPVIVRCSEHSDMSELISLGADQVVPEMLEASLLIGAQVLTILGVPETKLTQQLDEQRKLYLEKG